VKKLSNLTFEKIEDVLYVDKIKDPKNLEKIVASEIYYVLKQYFEIDKNSFNACIFVEKDGVLNINCNFKAFRTLLKKVSLAIDS